MHILLTGGGTGGHILPHEPIIDLLREKYENGVKISYIGSKDGPEKEFAQRKGICFYSVPCGKLRRYFDLRNVTDWIRVFFGILKSMWIILQIKPDKIFSKGGFVSVPVVIAAGILRKKIVIHESDVSMGLATKIGALFATKIMVASERIIETSPSSIRKKMVHSGNPVRKSLAHGNVNLGYAFLVRHGLVPVDKKFPVLLVMGGSSGAKNLNDALLAILPNILPYVIVLHVTGKGKGCSLDKVALPRGMSRRYIQVEYIGKELKHLYACSIFAVSRAGAGAVAEMNYVKLPAILVPLSSEASRGDQYENAKYMASKRSIMIEEGENFPQRLKQAILYAIKESERSRMRHPSYYPLAKVHERAASVIVRELCN